MQKRTIDQVDLFYLSMPSVLDIGDGSQDALLVRVVAGEWAGWGECEASPLTTIASMVSPMSHSACKPVLASVLGESVESAADILRIHQNVRANSMDLLQSDHALSGIDVALWDLLGKMRQEPVYRLLGFTDNSPKIPYCSLLFGDSPQETLEKAADARRQGFQALKLGWGPFGHRDLQHDIDQVVAAREGLGIDGILCIDAGTVWQTDVDEAARRLAILEQCNVTWLEEPFHTGALHAYHDLAQRTDRLRLAGGEGAHNEFIAQQMIDYGGIGFVQVDTGRIGGITSGKRAFDHAHARGVHYVNHTFTSHLALSASLQPYAGAPEHRLCEYPGQLSSLARDLTREHLLPDANGEICVPDAPGLGMTPNPETIRQYLVDTELTVNGRVLYRTPSL